MVEWLAPVALYWTMAALYLGGFRLDVDGGGGLRQTVGVFATFALYLLAWYVVRAALRGPVGVVPAVIFGCLIATLLLPLLARAGFRLLGVRVKTAA